jgi:F420-non-reducing hydrogenase small subunit
MATNGKPKLALYWAASCGGCEITVANIGANILKVGEAFDIVFWPCIVDGKTKDIEAMDDGEILICLFNGAIRTSEQEEMAHLLRRKSQVLVAFGSCACEGCIPGLANLTTKDAIFQTAYIDTPTTDNPDHLYPSAFFAMPEGEIDLPEFYEDVKTLEQVVPVEYFIPGCPPEAEQVWNVLQVVLAIVAGEVELPPAGTVLGANVSTVCDECPLEKREKKVTRFYRNFEKVPEPGWCLLEQGLFCMGLATRGGCGAKCPQVGIGCEGCYGPTDGVLDVGARMIAAIGSLVDSKDPAEIDAILDGIPDPAGKFYRFGMAGSLLHRVKTEE